MISVPHSGTEFPDLLRANYRDEIVRCPVDTDWLVDEIYDFAPSMGIGLVSARYSRYVIDLNRNPARVRLYNDKRRETTLVPSTTFEGESLFKDGLTLSENDIGDRLKQYFWPYYQFIDAKLHLLKQQSSRVLLYDAHSIKRMVSAISAEPFPDMILGSADESSADKDLIDTALKALKQNNYTVNHNFPFKGGQITRHFGKPETGIHALQLERSQDIYMDERTIRLDPTKVKRLRSVLKTMFEQLADVLLKKNEKRE